jgi:Tfp pilus assembly protein PilF
MRRRGLGQAGKYFAEAIEKDPNFALAYSGQADYFAYLTVLAAQRSCRLPRP